MKVSLPSNKELVTQLRTKLYFAVAPWCRLNAIKNCFSPLRFTCLNSFCKFVFALWHTHYIAIFDINRSFCPLFFIYWISRTLIRFKFFEFQNICYNGKSTKYKLIHSKCVLFSLFLAVLLSFYIRCLCFSTLRWIYECECVHVWLYSVRVLAKLFFCGVNEFQRHYYIWRTCYERYAFFYCFLMDKPHSQCTRRQLDSR